MDSSFYFERTRYWSQGDEQAHFEWLGRIGAVRDVRGKGRRLYLEIDQSVGADDLVELQAIYRRYGGDLNQLETLKVSANAQN